MASAEIHNDLTPLAPGKLPAQLLASTGVPISQAPQTWRRNNCFTSLKRVQQVLADAQAQLPTDQQKPAFNNAAISQNLDPQYRKSVSPHHRFNDVFAKSRNGAVQERAPLQLRAEYNLKES